MWSVDAHHEMTIFFSILWMHLTRYDELTHLSLLVDFFVLGPNVFGATSSDPRPLAIAVSAASLLFV